MDIRKIGVRIGLLCKEKGYTQETLAEALSISPQAVSKWENGHSLPDTALLPDLARILDCSIDNILLPNRVQILEAIYGDGFEKENITKRPNRLVDSDRITVTVNSVSMACNVAKGRTRQGLDNIQAGDYVN